MNEKRQENRAYDQFNEKVFLSNSLHKSNKKERLSIFQRVNKMNAINSFKISSKSKPLALKLDINNSIKINEYGTKDQAVQSVSYHFNFQRILLVKIRNTVQE